MDPRPIFSYQIKTSRKRPVKTALSMTGTPDRSRTCNLFLRTELLYPIELPRHTLSYYNKSDLLERGRFF